MTAYTDSVGDIRQQHDIVDLMIDSGAATHVWPQWFAPRFQLHGLPTGDEPPLRYNRSKPDVCVEPGCSRKGHVKAKIWMLLIGYKMAVGARKPANDNSNNATHCHGTDSNLAVICHSDTSSGYQLVKASVGKGTVSSS